MNRRSVVAARFLLLAALIVPALTGPARAGTQDIPVTLRIANDGAQPLRCMILFGHWVSRDLALIDAGGSQTLTMMRRDSDGSLYIAREDGRPMMIENLVCGAGDAWAETFGQVPLLPVRGSSERDLWTSCREEERITCSLPQAKSPGSRLGSR